MTHGKFSEVIHSHSGESYRVALMAGLFFFVLAANNLIKTLRDSIFLEHHSVAELPYLYILVAVLAGTLIATYTKYTVHISVVRLILASNVVILSNVVFFWFLFTYFDSGWTHYAYYIWSAIVSVTVVSQLWTLANHIFTPEEGKKSFGFLAAGGTLGGAVAGFGVNWSLHFWGEVNHLIWAILALYLAASALVVWAEPRLEVEIARRVTDLPQRIEEKVCASGILDCLAGSTYLRTISLLILASVVVSTLIDFQFKLAAKQVYSSKNTLAVFFGSYYGWLSVASFFSQVVLTGKILSKFGLQPSLYLTPTALLAGAASIMVWPSLLVAAMTRMADAALRNSIHRSGMEVVYMAIPIDVMRRVKSFLDVVIERIGDATAGFIILAVSFTSGRYATYVHFICIALLLLWMGAIYFLDSEEALRKRSKPLELAPTEDWLARTRADKSLMD